MFMLCHMLFIIVFAAKIGLFYLIFYSCLAGFFAAMLAGFFATLDDDAPTQKGMYSLIKGNPGMRELSVLDFALNLHDLR